MASASVVNTENATFDLDRLKMELSCPLNSEPLHSAVTLIPCSHRVNEAAAKAFFGQVTEDGKIVEDKQCPVCERNVIEYFRDYPIRDIADRIFGNPEASITPENLENLLIQIVVIGPCLIWALIYFFADN